MGIRSARMIGSRPRTVGGRNNSTRAADWWLRLFGVFPVEDFESGSVFGLIIGDPDPVTLPRNRVVPVCNPDLSLPTPPHTASGQAR
jgi:hypothetical protein